LVSSAAVDVIQCICRHDRSSDLGFYESSGPRTVNEKMQITI
jgi:hypothetical protein